MDESSTHDYLRLLELFRFFGLSISHSSNKKQYYHWLASIASSPSVKGRSIVVLRYFILKQVGNDILEQIRLMLGVNIRHVS